MRRMNKSLVKLMLVIMLVSVSITAKAAQPVPFSDVPAAAWYLEDLRYLLDHPGHIFSGYLDGTFKPDEPLTADMFIKLIVTAMGDEVELTGDYWASAYIVKALEKGYIHPSDGFLAGADNVGAYDAYRKPITRESMALLAGRALELMPEEKTYRDSLSISSLIVDYKDISSDAKSNVIKCYDLGVLSGYPDGEFKPRNQLTRAEAVSVIRRLIDADSRRVFTINAAANPGPTPVPVTELNRPEQKTLEKGMIEVEGIRIDPSLDYIRNTGGVMSILKADEFVDVVLNSLRFYEFNEKVRMRGYIPQLPDGYIWSFSVDCGVYKRDDRGFYGGTYTNSPEEQPEYSLPSNGQTFDVSLYTNRENIQRLVLTCEILTPEQKSGGKFIISFIENTFTTEDFYGGFDGTYPFDGQAFFVQPEINPEDLNSDPEDMETNPEQDPEKESD